MRFNSVFLLSRTDPMTHQNNPNRIKIYGFATHRKSYIWRNATVLFLTAVSFLLACYLTDKGYKSCLEAGKYSRIECEKLHLG